MIPLLSSCSLSWTTKGSTGLPRAVHAVPLFVLSNEKKKKKKKLSNERTKTKITDFVCDIRFQDFYIV